jgi:hypothetical protein
VTTNEPREGWLRRRRALVAGLLAAALFALLAWGAVQLHRRETSRQFDDAESPLQLLDPRTWTIAPDERKKPHEEAGELLDHVEKNPPK